MKEKNSLITLAKFISKEVFWRREEYFYPPEMLWSEKISINDIKKALEHKIRKKEDINVYVHIPFCASRCQFCAYLSFSETDKDIHNMYLKSLEKEIVLLNFPKKYKIKTLYIGGGTPSVFSDSNFKKMFVLLDKYFNLNACRQINVEMSPYTVSKTKTRILKNFGVKRVTLGVQTFDEVLLKKMNRLQSRKDVYRACSHLKEAEIKYINIDLMAGLPFQGMDSFRDSLEEALRLNPSTITICSFVPVTLSNFSFRDKIFNIIKIRQKKEMLSMADKILSGDRKLVRGKKDEMESNVQLLSYQCSNSSILGLGYGAISHISCDEADGVCGLRYKKSSSLKNYMKRLEKDLFPILVGYKTNIDDEMRTFIINNLHTEGRISVKNFRDLFHRDLRKIFEKEVNYLLDRNKIYFSDDYLTASTENEIDKFICAKVFYGKKQLREFKDTVDLNKYNAEKLDFELLCLENRDREFSIRKNVGN